MSRRAPNQRGLCIVEPASLAIKSRLAVVAWAWLILAPTRRNEEQLGAGLSGEARGGSNPSLPAIHPKLRCASCEMAFGRAGGHCRRMSISVGQAGEIGLMSQCSDFAICRAGSGSIAALSADA